MLKNIFNIIIFVFFLTSCASFIEEEEITHLKIYEKSLYTLKMDINAKPHSLKKGQRIKLYLVASEEYIKVYGYPEDVDFLKSERALILYLFEDDFKDSRFKKDIFETKLFSIVQPVK